MYFKVMFFIEINIKNLISMLPFEFGPSTPLFVRLLFYNFFMYFVIVLMNCFL